MLCTSCLNCSNIRKSFQKELQEMAKKKKKKGKMKNCQVHGEPQRMGNPKIGRIDRNAPRYPGNTRII